MQRAFGTENNDTNSRRRGAVAAAVTATGAS